MKAGGIVFLGALLISSDAWSMDTYCLAAGVNVYDGGDFRVTWRVVNSAARRAQLPGQKNPDPGCYIAWNSVGALYRPITIIQKPTLGEAKVFNTYRLGYRSAKTGQDTVTVRIDWVDGSTGKLSSAVVHMNIQVTDKPL
jgi:hypothetical protein